MKKIKFHFVLLILTLSFQISYPQSYEVLLEQKITENEGNFNIFLNHADEFGYDVESIGDLNGDGINDIAISARQDDDGGSNRGAIYILFLNSDGTVNSFQKISDLNGGFLGNINDEDFLGASISYLGDINGDGLIEIGIGAEYDDDGGYNHGAVYILSLNSNGTVSSFTKISDTEGGFNGYLAVWEVFGSDIAPLGDLNGDGNPDIAVGARRDPDGNSDRGAVWVLFLNADFTVNSYQKISDTAGNFNAGLQAGDYFGGAVANIGDLNNDGVVDLAVGAYRDDEGGTNHGAVYILFLNSDGTVGSYQKINEAQGNFNENFSGSEIFFGISIDKCADINDDGLTEIIVGASGYRNSANEEIGAFYILNLNSDGTVDSYEKYTENQHSFTGPLNENGAFGFSVSYIGALQEAHAIVIGAYSDPVGGVEKGSAWVLQIGGTSNLLPDVAATLDEVSIACNSRIVEVDYTISNVGDGVIPANTPLAFYADTNLVGAAVTQNNIPVGGSETGNISLNIPANIPENFTLSISVDDDGSGTGTIEESNENNNTDTLLIELTFPKIINLENLFRCDDDNDTIEIFDLTVNTPNAIGVQTDVTVTYHLSQNDANIGANAISTPATYANNTNPQEVFVRMENNMDSTCYATDSFMLRAVVVPVAFSPDPMFLCDDLSNDGIGTFDLTSQNSLIIGNQNDVNITFYRSQNEATTGVNPILTPTQYQNTSNPQTIYVRVESSFFSNCFSIVSFDLNVTKIDPLIVFKNLNKCDEGFDSASFNLTSATIESELYQNISGYYLTEEDAINQSNSISTPRHYQNTKNPQTIYVRLDNPTGNCYQLGAFELSTQECPIVIPQGYSPNNDGINDTFEISGLYDVFPNFELTVFSRNGNIVYKGNNEIPAWNGTSNYGLTGNGKQLPTGTYYYVLNLNDADYNVIKSWVYLIR